jgi:hypothetical protein
MEAKNEAATTTKKGSKLMAVIRYVLAAIAGAAIGYGAEKLDIQNTEAVTSIKEVVTSTIKGEDLTEEQKQEASEAAKALAAETIQKAKEEKK